MLHSTSPQRPPHTVADLKPPHYPHLLIDHLILFSHYLITRSTPHIALPNLSGSLTTLLIAHLATLKLGDHLEFYVWLTGLLKIPIFNALLVPFLSCCLSHKVQSSGKQIYILCLSLYARYKHSATLEDYPPLVLATLGGFLQQLFGARRLLQVYFSTFTLHFLSCKYLHAILYRQHCRLSICIHID